MSYFSAVRFYSALELGIFLALVATAVSSSSETAELVLGWTHGVGWIVLCVAVAVGCTRKVFPWTLLAATVSPLGPLGSTAGLEWLSHRRRRRVA